MSLYVPPNQASDEAIARALQEQEYAAWNAQIARQQQQAYIQQQQLYIQQQPAATAVPPISSSAPTKTKPAKWYTNPWTWAAITLLLIGLGIGIAFLAKHLTTAKEYPYWLDTYNNTFIVPVPPCLAEQTRPSEAWFDVEVTEKTGLRDVDGNAAGMDPTNSDNFDALTRSFSDCKYSNGCRIFVRPGVYRFTKEQPLFLRGLDGVTLDGQGSLFLFRRESVFSRFLAFETTSYLTIKNLRIDWDWSRWRVASVVEILSIGSDGGVPTMDLGFVEVKNVSLRTINKWFDMQAVDSVDFTVGVRDENRQGQFWGLDSNVISEEKIFDRVNVSEWDPSINQTVIVERNATTSSRVRLKLKTALSPIPTGFYLIRHFSYEGHALQFVGCSYCILDNVTIYSAIGMGIAFHENSHHIVVKNSKIGIFQNESSSSPRDYTRHISTASDGLNFINTQGFIKIVDSEVGFQGDDCVNINARVGLGFSRLSSNQIIALDWEKLRVSWKVGDVLEIKEADLSPTFAPFFIVTSADWIVGQGWRLGLNQEVPVFTNSDATMVLVNRRYNSDNVIVQNLHCHSNRARGALLQGSNTVVERSCFSNQQKEAIRITSERNPGKWAEGSGTQNVLIVNNRFANVDELDNYNGVIKVIAEMGTEGVPSSYTGAHRNISIRSNVLHNMPRRSIMIASASDVSISNNIIANDEPNLPETPERGQVVVSRSTNVIVSANAWTTSEFTTRQELVVRGPDAVNVTIFPDNVIR